MENYALPEDTFANVDSLWILISAALVFFMQAGFKVLETGLVKEEHRAGIGVKNLMDWVAGSLAFFLVGFGLMFGTSAGGVIGTDLFFGNDFDNGYTFVFFIFQLAFAGTALTIVSGAMSGRTALGPYFVASLFTAIIVYPVFGHWAWGNLLNESNEPWLASLGFMDFAGSTVVHSVGAWVGLVGIWLVGPRLGRFTANGKLIPVKASDYAYSILGLMILWLGWWGFNGGSTLSFDANVPIIILNTNLAAAAACLSAYLHAKFVQKNQDLIEKVIGGSLTGLVAITACCNVVTPISSIFIGLLAGLIHNLAYVLISEKWKLDDPVGAIPVHGFGGAFGTLCVALFGKQEMLAHDRWTQLSVQGLGIVVCLVFTMGVSYVIFYLVKFSIGLRLSPTEEIYGDVFGAVSKEVAEEAPTEQSVSQVSVRMGVRSYNLFKVDEYLNLPRETRIGLIRNESVQYLDDSGNQVPTLQAVRFLAGVIEDKRGATQEDLVELSLFKEREDIIGGLQDILLGEDHSVIGVFRDSFVLLEARGKVAGDFYWHGKEKGYSVAVAASCKDPDISNAFISALTVSQLNEIVGMKKILPPEKILESLNEKLSLALQKNNTNKGSNYGLDIGILVVDTMKRHAYYAGCGAGIKLYVKKLDEKLVEFKGIDVPLGKGARKFERVKTDYSKGDAFYLCSDGFANQLDENGKRYSTTQLRDFLERNGGKSMQDQKMIIGEEFAAWKGKEKQTEDVLLIGIKP
ncbi:MAG: ammonium transporter [Cyclobacteriaceae bacterium]